MDTRFISEVEHERIKQMCDESGGHSLRGPNFPDRHRVLKTDKFKKGDKVVVITREPELVDRVMNLVR